MKIRKKPMMVGLIVLFVIAVATAVVLNLPTFGASATGSRLERIQHSPHYKDGAFEYPIPTPTMDPAFSFWKLLRAYMNPLPGQSPAQPLPVEKTDLKVLKGSEPLLVWFGHSSYFLRINGKNILIDPVFCERPSPFQFIGSKRYPGTEVYSADDFPELDAVILTHDHYDHLDYEAIMRLISKTRHFHAALGVGAHLERWGASPGAITEYDWGDRGTIGTDIELIATPARHFSGRGFRRNKTLWTSFVFRTNDLKLFLGGDSGFGPHFKEIGEKYGPFDLAFLECGQYNEMWPRIHMMPEETAQAAVELKARTLMPVHWAKFTLGLHPWKEPIERVVKKAGELHLPLMTPRIGQVVMLKDTLLPTEHWWAPLK